MKIEKKTMDAFFLLSIASILVLSLVFIFDGVKNYLEADSIAKLIEPSGVYKEYGYKTIGDWKRSFREKNLESIIIGLALIPTAGLLFYLKGKMVQKD